MLIWYKYDWILTVLEAILTEVRYNRWFSHRLKNLELNILLITVRWWLSLHKCISPSCINLNLGPTGLLGKDLPGELHEDWNTPSSMLDCRDHWWTPNTDDVDDDWDEDDEQFKVEDIRIDVILISVLPLEVLDTPDEWVVVGDDEAVAMLLIDQF